MLRDKVQEASVRHSVRLLVIRVRFRVDAAQVVICCPASSQELNFQKLEIFETNKATSWKM